MADYSATPETAGARTLLATLLVLSLAWSAIPAVASAVIAASRDENVALAVLVGIVLGWIGLLLVVFFFKPEVASAARSMPGAVERASSSTPGQPRDTRSRLLELDQLKQDGLVTPMEYESRRARILEEI